MIAHERLMAAFVEMADTLVDDFDVIDFLHHLAEHTAAISGASSVGLLLGDESGQLSLVAATSEGAEQLEKLQLQHSEGPSLDCLRTHHQVLTSDLNRATWRWPSFAPLAVQAGYRSVHAFPMRLRDEAVGALNIFGETETSLDNGETRVIQALADVATIGLLQQRGLSAADTVTLQLKSALDSRILIEQAKGLVAHGNDVDMREAFELMRGYARSHHVLLTNLADAVVRRELDPQVFRT